LRQRAASRGRGAAPLQFSRPLAAQRGLMLLLCLGSCLSVIRIGTPTAVGLLRLSRFASFSFSPARAIGSASLSVFFSFFFRRVSQSVGCMLFSGESVLFSGESVSFPAIGSASQSVFRQRVRLAPPVSCVRSRRRPCDGAGLPASFFASACDWLRQSVSFCLFSGGSAQANGPAAVS